MKRSVSRVQSIQNGISVSWSFRFRIILRLPFEIISSRNRNFGVRFLPVKVVDGCYHRSEKCYDPVAISVCIICARRLSMTKVTVWHVGWKVGNFVRIKYGERHVLSVIIVIA